LLRHPIIEARGDSLPNAPVIRLARILRPVFGYRLQQAVLNDIEALPRPDPVGVHINMEAFGRRGRNKLFVRLARQENAESAFAKLVALPLAIA
jgi:hypothetical protein